MSIRKIDAVIFDLDGVICHTDIYHYQAWQQACDEAGIYFDRKINNRLRGVSRMDCVEIILDHYHGNKNAFDRVGFATQKNRYYLKLLEKMGPKDIGIPVLDTLMELQKRRKLLAIGSSSKNAPFIIEMLGITYFFDVIIDGSMLKQCKPDPEVFIKAAQALNTEASKTLVVEDAISGVQAGVAGGFRVAGIGEAATSPLITYKITRLDGLLSIGELA